MGFPCAPQPIVTFNYLAWIAQYPEFGSVTQPQAQGYAAQAITMLPLDQICDPNTQTIVLNAATAHFATIFASLNGQAPRGLVGRIANATEGSVSVGTAYTVPMTDSQAFWSQTNYGAYVWAATVSIRMGGFYVPPANCPAGVPGWPYGLR